MKRCPSRKVMPTHSAALEHESITPSWRTARPKSEPRRRHRASLCSSWSAAPRRRWTQPLRAVATSPSYPATAYTVALRWPIRSIRLRIEPCWNDCGLAASAQGCDRLTSHATSRSRSHMFPSVSRANAALMSSSWLSLRGSTACPWISSLRCRPPTAVSGQGNVRPSLTAILSASTHRAGCRRRERVLAQILGATALAGRIHAIFGHAHTEIVLALAAGMAENTRSGGVVGGRYQWPTAFPAESC